MHDNTYVLKSLLQYHFEKTKPTRFVIPFIDYYFKISSESQILET